MQGARFIPGDPATQQWDGVDDLPGAVGSIWFDPDTGYEYKLVRLADDLTNGKTAAGEVLVYKTGPTMIVTNDVSDGIDGGVAPLVAGVAMGVFTDSTDTTDDEAVHILVMVRGVVTLTVTDGSVVAGNALMADTGADGGCKAWTATTSNPTLTQLEQGIISVFAFALEDDDANSDVDAYVNVRS